MMMMIGMMMKVIGIMIIIPNRSIRPLYLQFLNQFTAKPAKVLEFLCVLSDRDKLSLTDCLNPTHLRQLTANTTTTDPHVEAVLHLKSAILSQIDPSLARFIASRPFDWSGCVMLARDQFERYFNHRVSVPCCLWL